ncbi:MAG: hypothetical protein P8099_11440 [Gemmatimonadota bacterium]|jgi:hypothetical protein
MKAKQTFVVGRRTSRSTVVVVAQQQRAPIRGPWTLRAIVTPRRG